MKATLAMASSAGESAAPKPQRILGLRLIVTVVAALLTTAGVLGVGVVAERQSRENLNAELRSRLLLTARNLAMVSASALLSEYPELTLHPLIREMQREEPALAFAVVVDHEGVIQGHSDARRLGEIYAPPERVKALAGAHALRPGEFLGEGPTLILAESPVLHPSGQPIGKAIVGMRRSYVAERVQAARQQQLLLVGGILLVSLALILLLMSRLLRPVGVLRSGLERIGHGDLTTALPVSGRTEFSLLAAAVNDMAAKLRGAQVELVEKERLARELELAREIQSSLLPEGELAAGAFLLAGAHRAAAEVGGDYYDFLTLPDGRVALAIADVSGKGLGGCMIMSMLSALWRSHAPRYDSPRELLLALDAQLATTLKSGQFVTMFYGILDVERGLLRYASAAHCPLLLRKADGSIEWRVTRGIPLGALSSSLLAKTLDDEVLPLDPGDLLLQYTDGVNEAFNPGGEQFALTGIERCVAEAGGRGARAVIETLRAAVSTWIGGDLPSDDETLLVLAHQGSPAAGGKPAAGASAADAAGAGEEGALACLARAEREGRRLTLKAELAGLGVLHEWVRGCVEVDILPAATQGLIVTAVYEAAANVAEHACGLDPRQDFDLWWVAPAAPGLSGGYFLLRDGGRSFHPEERPASDLRDPAVRQRGRGLGLDLIRGISSRFEYFPGTAAGNLTLLAFALNPHPTAKEPLHAS